ncbi:MAG: zinc metallopeptidase [Meiothermus sp.]|uniref:KPN_02809 family neutral zinc metallopeptidase n=1 Tax=Meiothermus sp. TaxID=1955249 RepID=UPI0025FFED9C|nr:neutral zinc metallopeptidase [Meiothermus sp.]MCS7068483.1 zinc metallopeptidase [Meiothermus sp.]MCX7601315.1 zinc metallopeptidase [Meiothermus sp.]MDW8425477.1 neutral zinc metallopeptidase [Meiothermus sp.]
MKWEDLRKSQNVEDRRGSGPRMGGPAGLGIGAVILALLGGLLFGVNPADILSQLQGGPVNTAPAPQNRPAEDREGQFVRSIVGDLEDTWGQMIQGYRPPRLVLFDGQVESACGFADAAVGPFYCPRDAKVYLDTSFFEQLGRLARGQTSDFAKAYVIAHEVGHHIQNLLGISDQVRAQQARSSQAVANQLSVRLELQADCLAGVWGHYAQRRGLLEFGDVEGAIAAASAIGDDNLQRRSQGYVVPEAFTHGSSEQRVGWFKRGFQSGDPNRCDTFR